MSPTPPSPLVGVVTGAGAGIGRGVSQYLAREGFQVVLTDVDEDAARNTADTIEADGNLALARRCDVANDDDVDQLFDDLAAIVGRIDVIINNAAICTPAPLSTIALTQWQREFAVNVEGVLRITQRAVARMLTQEPHVQNEVRGKIINMGSPAALIATPPFPAYGASKAALAHLSRTTADAYADALISTSLVHPGSVREGMWQALGPALAESETISVDQVYARQAASSPTGRFQAVEDLGRVICHVAQTPGMALNGATIWSEAHVVHAI